jgi:hypothetical protein
MKVHQAVLVPPLIAVTFALAACTETIEASYATFAEAEAAGAITKGWVPHWLPPSTTGIREVHNLDTNRFMLRFAVPKGTDVRLPERCKQVALNVPTKPPFRRSWWPSDVPASGLATHRHSFFGCNGTFIAYSVAQAEGFVWSAE